MPELYAFIPPQGWLKDGQVPAGTICPFRIICNIAQENGCKHKSQEHDVDFSCAAARAFALGLNYNNIRRPLKPTGGGGKG